MLWNRLGAHLLALEKGRHTPHKMFWIWKHWVPAIWKLVIKLLAQNTKTFITMMTDCRSPRSWKHLHGFIAWCCLCISAWFSFQLWFLLCSLKKFRNLDFIWEYLWKKIPLMIVLTENKCYITYRQFCALRYWRKSAHRILQGKETFCCKKTSWMEAELLQMLLQHQVFRSNSILALVLTMKGLHTRNRWFQIHQQVLSNLLTREWLISWSILQSTSAAYQGYKCAVEGVITC